MCEVKNRYSTRRETSHCRKVKCEKAGKAVRGTTTKPLPLSALSMSINQNLNPGTGQRPQAKPLTPPETRSRDGRVTRPRVKAVKRERGLAFLARVWRTAAVTTSACKSFHIYTPKTHRRRRTSPSLWRSSALRLRARAAACTCSSASGLTLSHTGANSGPRGRRPNELRSAVSMFDWFAPAAAEQQAEINKPGNVAELMKETEFVDEDGNGVDDNFEQWVEETRAGTVTRSKYSKYLVAENNRQAVAEMKRVAEEKESMRQAMTNKFQEAAKKNVKESRMQRARALSMVRRHKDEMAQRGTSTKEQIAAAKQLAEEKQLLENQQNAQLAIELGKQQRERLQQNRDETLKEQQQAARALKEEGKEKVAARLAAEQAILESKQRKAKTIKEQTRPEGGTGRPHCALCTRVRKVRRETLARST